MQGLLENIKSPKDLRGLAKEELPKLAEEIREFLLENLSRSGGHLASNLGVVELTMALHYCFDFSMDKIVWDVGHQAYIHKILTGRKERFSTLRQFGGISGFPKPKESPYDTIAVGHSSTSISNALGLAKARDLLGQTHHVVAVIGDGSMTGGLAYEALNNAGKEQSNLIVILNDNQMSIEGNVGALSRHLTHLRTGNVYQSAKDGLHRFAQNVPVLGKPVYRFFETVRDGAKYLLLPGVLFEEMGFRYFGPIDGHDFDELLEMFQNVQKLQGPILIHVKTTKGKGYSFAEDKPWAYHGVSRFDVKTGQSAGSKGTSDYSSVFGTALTELAKKNQRIVAITAAMTSGTGLTEFQSKYPKRFFDVGIAEQHAVSFAAGLAAKGMRPVVAVYSTFLQRAYDQIVHDVCLEKLPVVFAIDRAGLVGADGETHQGIFDISYLSHIPNLTILSPKNKAELIDMLSFAMEYNGPIAIRYPRGTASLAFEGQQDPIVYGKGEVLRQGKGVALLAEGHMVERTMEVAEALAARGIDPMVVNMRFIKPLDEELLLEVAKNCSTIFTIEDNVVQGGIGSKILECYSQHKIRNLSITNLGFPDQYIEHGTQEELYQKYRLDASGILSTIGTQMEKETNG